MSISNLPRTPGVYLIVNTTNQHCYVGSTNDLYKRYTRHSQELRKSKHHSEYLQRAYDLYGPDAFAFVVVDHLPDTSLLIEREQLFIDLISPEYNVYPFARRGGLTEEGLAKRSITHQAKKESGEYRPPNLGRKMSSHSLAKREATKKARREAGEYAPIVRQHTPETKAKIGAAQIGKEVSVDTIAKRRATREAKKLENPDIYKQDPEHMAKIRAASAETNRNREYPKQDPTHMAKMTEAARITNTGKKRDPAIGTKVSATRKANKLAKQQEQAQDVQQEKLF